MPETSTGVRTTKETGSTPAQERSGASGNADNSRIPELMETPVERMLTTVETTATAGTPTTAETKTAAGNQRTLTAAVTSPTAESTAKQRQQEHHGQHHQQGC
jgi:hypothetical protein